MPVQPSSVQDGCRPCTSQESYAQLSGCGRGQELQTVGFGLAIAFAIVLAIPVGLFWRRNPKYPLVFVLTIYFTLLDVITDILYVLIEPFSSPELLTAAIIFVGFAPLSLSTLFYYRVYQIGNPDFVKWLKDTAASGPGGLLYALIMVATAPLDLIIPQVVRSFNISYELGAN